MPATLTRTSTIKAVRIHAFGGPEVLQLSALAGLAARGHLRVPVEKVLPLAQAPQAQELSQSGHMQGKIVLRVAEG